MQGSLHGHERIVLLGGGTTIGFEAWGRSAALALRMYGARHLVAAGAGAARASDHRTLARQPQNWGRWSRLRGFDLWGVRGPYTRDECVREGWDAPVIGDPALLFPAVRPVVPARASGTVGLALGSEGVSRFSVPTVVEAARRAAQARSSDVTLFEFTAADRPVVAAARRLLGGATRVVTFDGDVDAMMSEIAACSVFISERLHGTVAATALDVPALPLSYGSKCDDFWASVAGEDPRVTPSSSASAIAAEIERCTAPAYRSHVHQSVRHARVALGECADALVSWLRGERDTSSLTGFRPAAEVTHVA